MTDMIIKNPAPDATPSREPSPLYSMTVTSGNVNATEIEKLRALLREAMDEMAYLIDWKNRDTDHRAYIVHAKIKDTLDGPTK